MWVVMFLQGGFNILSFLFLLALAFSWLEPRGGLHPVNPSVGCSVGQGLNPGGRRASSCYGESQSLNVIDLFAQSEVNSFFLKEGGPLTHLLKLN